MTTARMGVAVIVLAFGMTCAKSLWAVEHPVPLEKDFDAAQCVMCHEDKTKGKAVHSAIAMGCTACHDVKTGEPTTIELNAPRQELCFTCHEKSSDAVRHGPYDQGNCTWCHDPHATDFPMHTRAAPPDLCRGCHLDQPQINPETHSVTLSWNQVLTADEYARIPKLGLPPGSTRGHPLMGHPFSGKNTKGKGAEKDAPLSCLSCHRPHSSPAPKLLPSAKVMELCAKCHEEV